MARAGSMHEEGDAGNGSQIHEEGEGKDQDKGRDGRSADCPEAYEDSSLRKEGDDQGAHAEAGVDPAACEVRDEGHGAVCHERRGSGNRVHAEDGLEIGRHVAVERVDGALAEDEDQHGSN